MRHRYPNKRYHHPEQEESTFDKIRIWVVYLLLGGGFYYLYSDIIFQILGGK
jgi:hypothetical protein